MRIVKIVVGGKVKEIAVPEALDRPSDQKTVHPER
jgi:hypothetical protein